MSQKYLIRIAELESQLRQKDQQLSLVEETEAFLRSALARAEEKIEEDEREIEHLRAQIEKLHRMLFGARRKIHDVYISSKSATAEEALKRISELYAIEDEIRGLPESERLAARQQRSKALLTSLHEWMVEKNGTLSKKSRLGEAFSYVLNQWDALCYYSDDGLAEADNNTAERALRAVCLGKKNYVFFGSDHGGERGALLYGLIGTCRLNGIDPEAYLRHILSVLPEWPSNRVDELLPWNVVLTNK